MERPSLDHHLRVADIEVRVHTAWDDGDSMEPGPPLDIIHIPIGKLADFAVKFPDDFKRLREQLEAADDSGIEVIGDAD